MEVTEEIRHYKNEQQVITYEEVEQYANETEAVAKRNK